jgi:hypothetical protein
MSTPSQILSMFLGVPCGNISLCYEQPSYLTRTDFKHGMVNVSITFEVILGDMEMPERVGSINVTSYTVRNVRLIGGPVKVAQVCADLYPGDETTELLRSLVE